MPISSKRIGPYEIVAPLGSGGMGKVYRARDSKLGREVAVKILSAALTSDADYIARFEREAQVLELVEGTTLADAIEHGGPIPPAEALVIAKQIAGSPRALFLSGWSLTGRRR